jgi:hypothetical protein
MGLTDRAEVETWEGSYAPSLISAVIQGELCFHEEVGMPDNSVSTTGANGIAAPEISAPPPAATLR